MGARKVDPEPAKTVPTGVELAAGNVFGDVRGQDGAVKILQAALQHGRVAHAYFFVGPHGVGREMVARRLAAALLCTGRTPAMAPFEVCGACGSCKRVDRLLHPDVHLCLSEAERVRRGLLTWDEDRKPSVDIKVEQVRQLRDDLRLTAFEGGWRVAIFPQAEKLRVEAANALLKTLEEPLPNSLLILCAPDKGAILETLRSRCQKVAFAPLQVDTLTRLLQAKTGVDQAVAAAVAADSQGSMAMALGGEAQRAREIQDEAQAWLKDLQDAPPSDLLSRAEALEKDRDALDRLTRALLRHVLARAQQGLPQARAQGGAALEARRLLDVANGVVNLRDELARPGTNARLNLERFMLDAQAALRP